jgi:mRNA-degrading endonuclease toxin of MazEF toxin-antitoxin module
MTSRAKGYPFEVGHAAASGSPTGSVILADHVRNVAWSERRSDFIGRCDAGAFADVLQKVAALLGIQPHS